jgi:hypothetical protein
MTIPATLRNGDLMNELRRVCLADFFERISPVDGLRVAYAAASIASIAKKSGAT